VERFVEPCEDATEGQWKRSLSLVRTPLRDSGNAVETFVEPCEDATEGQWKRSLSLVRTPPRDSGKVCCEDHKVDEGCND